MYSLTYSFIFMYSYLFQQAQNLKQKTSSELALTHFDAFYRPVYGKLWPSVRISLLSLPKYCALVNHSATPLESCRRMEKLGAVNVLKAESARQFPLRTSSENEQGYGSSDRYPEAIASEQSRDEHYEGYVSQVDEEQPFDLNPNTNLHEFMPVEKVYSEHELEAQEVVRQSVFEPRDIGVKVMTHKEIQVPEYLMVYAFPKGNVRDFPPPKPTDNRLLGMLSLLVCFEQMKSL